VTPLRLGAVSYLNTKPLVYGLEDRPADFAIRFDVPARCATLLHEGDVDLGLIPAIEYLRGDSEYHIVPDVAIASDGDVATVALFTRKPIAGVESIALDLSSRTSVALTRVLAAAHWRIAPAFMPSEPDLDAMLARADAALVIGDPAFDIDPAAHGVTKMTGLPFVYAMWVGRPGAATAEQCRQLQQARERGVTHLADIARDVGGGDRDLEQRSFHYLRDNLRFSLGDREVAGLRRFHELAADLGLVPALQPLRFFQ
jgi:chorismate dehydratase